MVKRARARNVRRSTGRVTGRRNAFASRRRRPMARLSRQPATTTVRTLTGFPDKMRVRLPYDFNARVNSVLTLEDQRWNLNDIFDPDRTGGGHQPRGHDQWAQIYGRYRVYKVGYRISMRQRAAHGILTLLHANNDASAITDALVPEQPHSTRVKMTGSNQPLAIHSGVFYPNKITGVSWATYMSDDRYQANFGSSPAETIVLHQLTESVDSATAIDYEYTIKLVYYCELFDKIEIASS